MVAHPQSASGGLCVILKFQLDRIYNLGDRAIFIFFSLAWNCLTTSFRGFWGHISPNDVIYRHLSFLVPQKAPLCAETRRLSHKARKSVQRFDLGVGSRKKDRTGQGSQNSHKGVIFHLLGKKPHWTDFRRNLHSSCRPRRNHVCKHLNWNFRGLRFYRGSHFAFSYWFSCGPYNSAALTCCLWLRD